MMESPAPKGAARGRDHHRLAPEIVSPPTASTQTAQHSWIADVEGRALRIFSPTPATRDEIAHQLALRFPGAAVHAEPVGGAS